MSDGDETPGGLVAVLAVLCESRRGDGLWLDGRVTGARSGWLWYMGPDGSRRAYHSTGFTTGPLLLDNLSATVRAFGGNLYRKLHIILRILHLQGRIFAVDSVSLMYKCYMWLTSWSDSDMNLN